MRQSGTQRLVCLGVCVCICVPRGVQRDLMLRSRMGRKSRISRDPSHPSPSQQLRLTIEWQFSEKKSLLLYFIVQGFFHQPTLTRAKDLTINVSEAVTFRGQEQCERWMCMMGNKLNFLFCFSVVSFQLNGQYELLCVCVFVREHQSHLNLQNVLVASRCNCGLLKLLELGVFNIQ